MAANLLLSGCPVVASAVFAFSREGSKKPGVETGLEITYGNDPLISLGLQRCIEPPN